MRIYRTFRFPVIALCSFAVVYCFISTLTYFNGGSSRQHFQTRKPYQSNTEREAAVKDAFRYAWQGYMHHAFPGDALKPLSRSSQTTWSSWGATVVDGLTTAVMMDMPDVVDPMLKHIESINFAESNASVSLFGATIRYLGGLLSAHDLLTAVEFRSKMDSDGRWAQMLLKQAQSLVEALSFAYDTPSGIPQNNLRLSPVPTHKRTPVNDITAAGTPALEFFHFFQLTGNILGETAISALDHILAKSQPGTTPFPGLSGRYLDLKTGSFVDAAGGWYGGAGGFYEYLLKLYILSPARFGHYLDRWILAANSSMVHLASSPSSRPDFTFLASYNGTEILYNTDHTAHFAAANFLLAGSVMREKTFIDFGLALVNTQIEMYKATATGLGPDKYAWLPNYCHDLKGFRDNFDPANSRYIPSACKIPQEFRNQSSFYETAGYYITSPSYKLRPEVLESLYYAYRLTGDVKYQDASWDIFQKILKFTKIESGGFTGLLDVNAVPERTAAVSSKGQKGGMEDLQYSYMLAETLLYAWLIHADQDMPWHVQPDGKNTWVFNTEGHPLRVQET